jgi:hypothetical protein
VAEEKKVAAVAIMSQDERMNVMLVLIWSLSGQGLYVPMPNWTTCQEAIVQARDELNPARAYCTRSVANDPRAAPAPARQSITVSIIRNMKYGLYGPNQDASLGGLNRLGIHPH